MPIYYGRKKSCLQEARAYHNWLKKQPKAYRKKIEDQWSENQKRWNLNMPLIDYDKEGGN